MEIGNTNISSLSNDKETIVPFVFDAAYKGDDLTKRAAEIIGMKDITGWSVIDTFENLALLHYNKETDFQKFGHIRGILVDTENGDIIANSFGYTPIAISNHIEDVDGDINIKDVDGITHTFNLNDDNVSVKRVFEGVVIRVIWYNNKMYRITHKKINPSRSRWGNSKKFLDIYDSSNGPTADQLFDTSKPYSSTCYHFLAVDSSLLVGTRQKMKVPYLVYIERQEVELNRSEDEIAIGVPNFKLIDKISGTVTESGIYNPQQLTLNNVNRYLKYGYYGEFNTSDKRQLTGESVIIYRKFDGLIVDVVKINSESYEWRSNMRGGNPNVVNQFYTRLNMVYPDIKEEANWIRLKSNLIMFPLYDIDSMKELYKSNKGFLMIPVDDDFKPTKDLYETKQSRIHLFWINYVLSLPISHQEDALELLSNLLNDRNNLVKWLCTLENNVKVFSETEYSKYIIRIITYARNEASMSVKKGTNINQKGGAKTYKDMIKHLIFKLVSNERGPSLYAMVREMKKPNPNPNKKIEI